MEKEKVPEARQTGGLIFFMAASKSSLFARRGNQCSWAQHTHFGCFRVMFLSHVFAAYLSFNVNMCSMVSLVLYAWSNISKGLHEPTGFSLS